LTTTGVAATFPEAQRISREAAASVQFDGKVFRRDIGWREAARLEERRPIGAPQAG
jgi:phosphoribosylamine--glycine ligase